MKRLIEQHRIRYPPFEAARWQPTPFQLRNKTLTSANSSRRMRQRIAQIDPLLSFRR